MEIFRRRVEKKTILKNIAYFWEENDDMIAD